MGNASRTEAEKSILALVEQMCLATFVVEKVSPTADIVAMLRTRLNAFVARRCISAKAIDELAELVASAYTAGYANGFTVGEEDDTVQYEPCGGEG